MDKTIFREKSIERVSSPEQLDAYLKVTSPSVWIILGAIIVLLIGIICWGVIGTIETVEPTSCYLENGDLICYTTEDIAKKIDVGTQIKMDGYDQIYDIYSIEYYGQLSKADANYAHLLNAQILDHIYELRAKCDLPDSYAIKYGKIVIETISPIKFVFN